ncbi:MAG: biotin/lipoyl-containing protein [Gammaproteobacteria bacterium]
MPSGFRFMLDEAAHAVGIRSRRPDLALDVDGVTHVVRETPERDSDAVLIELGGRSYRVWRVREGNRVHIHLGGRSFSVGYEDAITQARLEAGGDAEVRADMPGVVVAVHRAAGEPVSAGDTLLVIESMKMQINIVAPRDGVVEVVHVEVSQTFDKGSVLVALAEDA